jgi:sec-independent protein translocase protein TatC
MRDVLLILTPIAVVLLVRTGVVTLEQLRRHRAYALIFAFVISAAVLPPNVIAMSIMAVSMYLLYEVGLLSARFFL